jgi:uncharacterized membrane protein YecN with MAPEG domain
MSFMLLDFKVAKPHLLWVSGVVGFIPGFVLHYSMTQSQCCNERLSKSLRTFFMLLVGGL